jgi:hypothetical protein
MSRIQIEKMDKTYPDLIELQARITRCWKSGFQESSKYIPRQAVVDAITALVACWTEFLLSNLLRKGLGDAASDGTPSPFRCAGLGGLTGCPSADHLHHLHI